MISRLRKKRRITASASTARRTGAKLALLAVLFGGSLAAQQPAPFRLAPPPGYRPHAPAAQAAPARPAGVVNPLANRDPIVGSGGRVMYFHKPADSVVPDPSPDLPPAETAVVQIQATAPNPDVIPSVLPAEMSPNDQRLALAPPAVPQFVNEFREVPVASDVPVSPVPAMPAIPAAPAAARTEVPVIEPFKSPYSPLPTEAAAESDPTTTRTAQKKQDITKPPDRASDRAASTRLPARDKIFVLYNDSDLEKAIVTSVRYDVQKMMKNGAVLPPESDDLYRFPKLAQLVPEGTVYKSKTDQYPPRTECFEPAYVVHRRLNFEQKNSERGGWDLGIAQPVVSTLVFYKDVLFWPHNLASGVHNCWDTSAGKCLPGSPTPFYVYPPEFSATGTIAETGVIAASIFIFP